jgi:hypothetical protein
MIVSPSTAISNGLLTKPRTLLHAPEFSPEEDYHNNQDDQEDYQPSDEEKEQAALAIRGEIDTGPLDLFRLRRSRKSQHQGYGQRQPGKQPEKNLSFWHSANCTWIEG